MAAMNYLAAVLRQLRKDDVSQADVTNAVGIAARTMTRIESEKGDGIVSLHLLRKILEFYKTTPEQYDAVIEAWIRQNVGFQDYQRVINKNCREFKLVHNIKDSPETLKILKVVRELSPEEQKELASALESKNIFQCILELNQLKESLKSTRPQRKPRSVRY